jgi:hypothetical protein
MVVLAVCLSPETIAGIVAGAVATIAAKRIKASSVRSALTHSYACCYDTVQQRRFGADQEEFNVAQANTKQSAILRSAQEKAAAAQLSTVVRRGHALLKKTEGKEVIVATCMRKEDADALFAVIRGFYESCMDGIDEVDDDDEDDEASERERGAKP